MAFFVFDLLHSIILYSQYFRFINAGEFTPAGFDISVADLIIKSFSLLPSIEKFIA